MRGGAAARTGRRTLAPLGATALLAALATGCGGHTDGSSHSYSSSETKVDVHVGEEFTLTVDENPSLPWRWYVGTPQPDPSVVRSADADHDPGSADPGKIGSGGGHHLFTFTATGRGSTEIVLLHCHVGGCSGGSASADPPSPTSSPSASLPADRTITYTVNVS